jgi:hypothetical protein
VDAGDREASDHSGARRLGLAEELGIDRVHGGEIVAVAEIHATLDHIRQGGAATFNQGFDIIQHLTGFVRDIAGDQLLGGGIYGDLAGDEDEIAGTDRRATPGGEMRSIMS